MSKENSDLGKKEINLIDLIIVIWNNKFHLILIVSLITAIGISLYYFAPGLRTAKNLTTINILIEDITFYEMDLEMNSEQRDMSLVNKMNFLLPSSSNYEKWSNKNPRLSKYFSQQDAALLKIKNETQTITVNLLQYNKTGIDSITSYLSHTAAMLSSRIIGELRRSLQIVKEKREKIISRKNLETSQIVNDMKNINIRLIGAEEELEFLNSNIEKNLINSPAIMLRKLELLNDIKVNQLILENLNTILRNNRTSKNQFDTDLMRLEREIGELESSIRATDQVVRLGRISFSDTYYSKVSLASTLTVSILIGLILGSIFLILKQEVKNRKGI